MSVTYAVDRLVDHMVNWDDLAGSTCCHHFVGRPCLLVGHIGLGLVPRLSGIQWVVVMDDRFVGILDLDLDAHPVVLRHLVEPGLELELVLLSLGLLPVCVHFPPPSYEPSILFEFP